MKNKESIKTKKVWKACNKAHQYVTPEHGCLKCDSAYCKGKYIEVPINK